MKLQDGLQLCRSTAQQQLSLNIALYQVCGKDSPLVFDLIVFGQKQLIRDHRWLGP